MSLVGTPVGVIFLVSQVWRSKHSLDCLTCSAYGHWWSLMLGYGTAKQPFPNCTFSLHVHLSWQREMNALRTECKFPLELSTFFPRVSLKLLSFCLEFCYYKSPSTVLSLCVFQQTSGQLHPSPSSYFSVLCLLFDPWSFYLMGHRATCLIRVLS